MAEKIDIFRILNQADKKNILFYQQLSEEEKKSFSPFLIQRWLSGTVDSRQVIFLNELLNPFIFSFFNHKHLLWLLITICTNGNIQKYSWNKLPGKQQTHSKPETINIISQYYGYSKKQAKEILNLLSYEEIIWYAEQLGKQPEEIIKLKKEWKNEIESNKKDAISKNIDDLFS